MQHDFVSVKDYEGLAATIVDACTPEALNNQTSRPHGLLDPIDPIDPQTFGHI